MPFNIGDCQYTTVRDRFGIWIYYRERQADGWSGWRWYCSLSSWPISPAKLDGATIMTKEDIDAAEQL